MTETDDQRLVRLETSHRIKNQLSLVSSMLALSASETEDASATGQLQRAADRVRAVATVHRLLLDQDERGTLPVDVVLAELCSALNQIYLVPMTFTGDAASVRLPGDTMMRIAMIVGELAGAPYALDDDGERTDSVKIATHKHSENLTIEVMHDRRALSVLEAGKVGTLIVEGFASQIGATYESAEASASGAATLQLALA